MWFDRETGALTSWDVMLLELPVVSARAAVCVRHRRQAATVSFKFMH